ncbi:MAG TPA: hypothetical protein VGG39_08775 [Polyangiaceae bacterium]
MLRIKIGASVDASVQTAFTSVEKAAEHAGKAIQKNFGEAAARATRQTASHVGAAAAPVKQAGQVAEQAGQKAAAALRGLGSLGAQTSAKFKEAAAEIRRMPADLRAVEREATRALSAMQRDRARAALGLPSMSSGRRSSRFWSAAGGNLSVRKPNVDTLNMDPVSGVARFGMSAASFAGRAALGLARAAGVETDLGSIATKNFNEEELAQKISSSGYIPGRTRLVHSGDILDQTRSVATSTATDRGDLLSGLQGFVAKTGDLDLGRSMLGDMAKLAKATGTEFADMAEAAAEVANHVGDIPDKGKVVYDVMRQVAGQGKLGAVEIRDLATQMAKVAATANQFKGGAAANIATLGVFAQESKLEGGSATSVQAATSVARFASGLAKPSNLKAWRAHGFSNGAFTDDTHSELLDPLTIVKMALRASSGQGGKGKASESVMSQLFPNQMAFRAVAGWQTTYNRAGGGDEGMAAVTKEFQRLHEAQLSEVEVTRAMNAVLELGKSKATIFNEQLGTVAEQLQGVLLPALEALAPEIVSLSESLVTAITRFMGIHPDADREARDDAARKAFAKAMGANLDSQLNLPPRKGQFPLMLNTQTSNFEPAHGGQIEGSRVAQLEKQDADISDELAKKQAEHDAYKRSAGYIDLGVGSGHMHYGHVYKPEEQAELNAQNKHLEDLKEQQKRTNDILDRIHEAVKSGQVTIKTAPKVETAPKADGAMPAEAP